MIDPDFATLQPNEYHGKFHLFDSSEARTWRQTKKTTNHAQVPADVHAKHSEYARGMGNMRRRFHGTKCSPRCNFFLNLRVSSQGTE